MDYNWWFRDLLTSTCRLVETYQVVPNLTKKPKAYSFFRLDSGNTLILIEFSCYFFDYSAISYYDNIYIDKVSIKFSIWRYFALACWISNIFSSNDCMNLSVLEDFIAIFLEWKIFAKNEKYPNSDFLWLHLIHFVSCSPAHASFKDLSWFSPSSCVFQM